MMQTTGSRGSNLMQGAYTTAITLTNNPKNSQRKTMSYQQQHF